MTPPVLTGLSSTSRITLKDYHWWWVFGDGSSVRLAFYSDLVCVWTVEHWHVYWRKSAVNGGINIILCDTVWVFQRIISHTCVNCLNCHKLQILQYYWVHCTRLQMDNTHSYEVGYMCSVFTRRHYGLRKLLIEIHVFADFPRLRWEHQQHSHAWVLIMQLWPGVETGANS